jgi:hypothetical protein
MNPVLDPFLHPCLVALLTVGIAAAVSQDSVSASTWDDVMAAARDHEGGALTIRILPSKGTPISVQKLLLLPKLEYNLTIQGPTEQEVILKCSGTLRDPAISVRWDFVPAPLSVSCQIVHPTY